MNLNLDHFTPFDENSELDKASTRFLFPPQYLHISLLVHTLALLSPKCRLHCLIDQTVVNIYNGL